MYAICSTKHNDVRNAVLEMVERHYTAIAILQFDVGTYKQLKDIPDMIQSICRESEHEATYRVNLSTKVIHLESCKYLGVKTVKANLVDLQKTGLHRCKKCIK